MPTPMRRRLRLARRGAVYGIAVVLVCMAVVLGIASQVLPLAERHPDRIAAWLSERAGRPVAFDAVKTRWTRRGPLLQLDGLRLGEGDGGVRIGQAEVLVSMYGGLLPGRSFTELRLRGLVLTARDLGPAERAQARRLRFRERLLELAIQPKSDFTQALSTILRTAAEVLDVGSASFWRLSRDPDVLRCESLFDRESAADCLAELHAMQAAGVDHIGLQFRRNERPLAETFHEIAEYVLPHFPAHAGAAATA